MHCSAYYKNKEGKKLLFIFGGRLIESISNEVFSFNTDSNKWEKLSNMPFSLCSSASTTIHNYIIFYGGTDGISFLNQISLFNLDTYKWYVSKFYPPEIEPGLGGRISPLITHDDDIVVIFGGSGFNKETNEVFVMKIEDLLDTNNLTFLH